MNTKPIWPITAIVCASIVSAGLYCGLRDNVTAKPTVTEREPRRTDSLGASETARRQAPPPASRVQETSPQPIAAPVEHPKPKPPVQPTSVTVYVTRTGKKYHRGTCSYLRRSRIAISLDRAKASYGPCSRCSPPR